VNANLMQPGRASFVARALVTSVLASFLCAALFVAIQQFTLPPSDLAFGQGLGATFSDPFVVMVAGTVASIIGLAIWPVAVTCLRGRDELRCGVFVIGTTVLFLVVVTPFEPRVGLFGAPLLALAGLLTCRFSGLDFFASHERTSSIA
jgi:hypothetical protein